MKSEKMTVVEHDLAEVCCERHGRIYVGPKEHAPEECPKCRRNEACMAWKGEPQYGPEEDGSLPIGACGECFCCRGDEPPMNLMPDPDGLTDREQRELNAGYAEAEAVYAAYYAGLVDNPDALLE
tara:strand:- start:557 stop:931 length:375 start_codon:yes stop_codon:yes gene_type:complete